MRYFTPERYLRLGNLEDEGAFLAAQDDWERAIKLYNKQLQRILADLPSGLRRLIGSVYLHDAEVLDMWMGAGSRFTVTLHPESDPSRLVVLAYALVEPPSIEEDVLPAGVRSEPVAWLYDELSIRRSVFHHDVLLSNGWELRLRFRSVTVKRPLSVIPLSNGGPKVAVAAR